MPKIPEFPEFVPIALEQRQEISEVLAAMPRPISEWTFTNLCLFREAHSYRVCRLGTLLLITGRGYDSAPYGFSPWGEGDLEEGARVLCRHLASAGALPVLFPVPRETFEKYFDPSEWDAVADRDQADYVYRLSDLAELPGKPYHKKKNRLAKFLRDAGSAYSYEELRAEHLPACIELARDWCNELCSTDRMSTFSETAAAVEALRTKEELGLVGGVSLVDGSVFAYCLGEPLDVETFVVHFEKARPGVEGLAQAINRDFCARTLGGFQWVNREQDLGDPGLRQAKEGYHPARLVEKLKVTPRVSE